MKHSLTTQFTREFQNHQFYTRSFKRKCIYVFVNDTILPVENKLHSLTMA
jgi:hypothetical protein